MLGGASSAIFGLSLLASGLSSSITIVPALIVIGLHVDPTQTPVISQVVLSFGIPFALVPLVMYTSNREPMGELVNRRITTATAGVVASLIIVLSFFLLAQTFGLA